MKKSIYNLILILIAVPASMMLGLQIGTLEKQHERNTKNFTNDIEKAITESKAVYKLWNSHTTDTDKESRYNSSYTNSDSTFSVMIAQDAQQYPLLDFRPDTVLPGLRQKQFLRFQEELEKTRRKENKNLREVYVFRSVQFCATCEEDQRSIATIFPMDSLIRTRLKENSISAEVEIAFFNPALGKYDYLSAASDTSKLNNSPFQYEIIQNQVVLLHFPNQDEVLRGELMSSIISSLGLTIISIFCAVFAGRMLLKQKKLEQMKSDFINNVTHEFKTPIATIKFALANIENDDTLKDPKAIKQFTKVINYENQRLNGQVERVLQTAALNSRTIKIKKERVEVHSVLQEVAKGFKIKLQSEDELSLKLDAENDAVEGDEFHISSLISNLLDNAIKYSGTPKVIRIESTNKGRYLQLRFIDNGIGISKDNQNQIFEQFFRVPTGDLHSTKGFGLGLSYVKTIVEAHEGEVQVQSKLNEGSTFTVLLPTMR